MPSEIVASFDVVITKGGTYRAEFGWVDENGAPVTFDSLQIDVTPNTGSAFSWTQANGKLTLQSAGVYLLLLTDTDTAAFDWTSGSYHFNGVESTSGDVNPCFAPGLVFVKDC